nr:hypothetical protein CFP56_41526 [Quercus suber]
MHIAIRVGGEVDDRNEGTELEEDGEEAEVLGRRCRDGINPEHGGNRQQREEVREQAVTRKESGANSATAITGVGVDAMRESRRETDF